MTNYEKYKDKIYSQNVNYFCQDFVRPIILEADECNGICARCYLIQAMWLMEEYKEPEVDWSNVAVDTPILVRDDESKAWIREHFAKYEDGAVFAWVGGNTSWTADGEKLIWKYAKLPEDRE